ncbi:hypothetical protein [Duganella sp. HH101]|nr:hypothetical protein [Duganella sp. HH101]
MQLKMLWLGEQALSSGDVAGSPVRVFDLGQPSVQWYMEAQPLQDQWLALRCIFHGGYFSTGAQGLLLTEPASPSELHSPDGLNRFGFRLVPEGNRVLLMNRAGLFAVGDGAGGFVMSSTGEGALFTVQDSTMDTSTFKDQVNACFNREQLPPQADGAPHDHRVRDVQWDDKEHERLVANAFAIVKAHGAIPGARRATELFKEEAFRGGLFKGLRDADDKGEYNDSIGIIPTYKSHFFNPATGKNWWGDTAPTALTQAIVFAYKSLSYCALLEDQPQQPEAQLKEWRTQAGYALGLALHYVTDLSQPMHAANFINWPLSGDWRHSGFEALAELVGAKFQLDPASVRADQIDPDSLNCHSLKDLIMALSQQQKALYDSKLKPLLARKVRIVHGAHGAHTFYDNTFTEEECGAILRPSLHTGQLYAAAFLLQWGRITDVWNYVSVFNRAHSSWAPTFFAYKGKTWVGFTDSDRWRVVLQPLDQMDRYPEGSIVVGPAATPAVGFESPAIAAGDDTIMVAYHDKGNQDLYVCQASGELSASSSWDRTKFSTARIKDFTNPAMARLGDELVLAWADYGDRMPGSGDRDGLYASYYNLKTGGSWSSPEKLPGRDTQRSPALAVYNDQLVMAWSGYHGGTPIFSASLAKGSRNWSSQVRLADDTATDRGPALAVQEGVLYLLWRRGDRVFYATGNSYASFSQAALLPVDNCWSHQDVRAFGGADNKTIYVGWNENWQMKYTTRRLT